MLTLHDAPDVAFLRMMDQAHVIILLSACSRDISYSGHELQTSFPHVEATNSLMQQR